MSITNDIANLVKSQLGIIGLVCLKLGGWKAWKHELLTSQHSSFPTNNDGYFN
jgi:hypothetical protein